MKFSLSSKDILYTPLCLKTPTSMVDDTHPVHTFSVFICAGNPPQPVTDTVVIRSCLDSWSAMVGALESFYLLLH